MDRPERFSLEWSEFGINLQNTFAHLRGEEEFSDVTLVSEDGHLVKAHKVLLAASSPLLGTILKKCQDHPKPLIFLRGAKTDVLNSLLDFVYFGKVEITGDMLDEFMALANELKVKGLSKKEDEDGASGENGSKITIGNKKMKKTNKLGLNEDIDMPEKSECNEIEEDTGDGDIKDDYIIEMSGNADWEIATMNLLDCNLCEKTSSTLQGLERHKYRYHPARRENIPEATETEEDNSELDTKGGIIDVSTSLVCEDATVISLDCNLCEKTSKTVQGLEMHKYRYHSAGGEKTMQAAKLKKPAAAEYKGPVFSCDLCDATSKSKGGLWQHKKRHH